MNDIEKRARDVADVLPAQVDAGAWPNGYGDGWNDCARIAHEEILPAIIAALSAVPKVPEGWALVPRIVSPAMRKVYVNAGGAFLTAQALHDAMLDASPQP